MVDMNQKWSKLTVSKNGRNEPKMVEMNQKWSKLTVSVHFFPCTWYNSVHVLLIPQAYFSRNFVNYVPNGPYPFTFYASCLV